MREFEHGSKRNLPLYILAGILIAMFGVPLGFGGVCVLVGLLLALTWIVLVFFAITGTTLLAGSLMMLLGLSRYFLPQLFDRMLELGVIQIHEPLEFLMQFSPAEQGMFFVVFASVILAAGLGMLWVGKRMLRGLRFLFSLAFDWARRTAGTLRKKLSEDRRFGVWCGGRFSAART